ncbi:PepSY-associated TM helix domain-containing protein [Pseudoalteromonas sp. MMG005]|uniref:PepSY-associated TM helix domain-containing protein n=1 Tax=Pseudoalteromonas sp. MMG005 TaxID=2822682 RepID=UPI001B39D6F8|nr:PepSY-associated TM helix domain-containing protein [Pseudoalteromonas sp. MMG005]MBQ4843925.1 PepSY domain-containing protein [Pseudoalteromonas sp. MMG005]
MKIRPDIIKTYQVLHTWTGICAGLLLFIGFFAGSLTMFRGAIDQWATPPSYQLPQVHSSQYDILIQKVLTDYPKAADSISLHFSEAHSPITWYESGNGRGISLGDQVYHATLDEQGELVAELRHVNELSMLVDYLHRTAGIMGEIGHDQAGVYVLGVASFLYFIALISGVIFLLPTLTKSFFALRNNKSKARFWLDTHNLIGVSSLPFHIIISFTVFVFAFHDLIYGGVAQIYGDKPLFKSKARSEAVYKVENLPKLVELQDVINKYAPEYVITQIDFSGLSESGPNAAIKIKSTEKLMRGPVTDFLYMQPYTFEISTSSVRGGDQGVWSDLVSSFFGLHFGSFGGDFGRWVYFFMGLLGAVLFYSGNLLWLEKRRNKQVPEQAKSSNVLASLTVGISIGCIAGIASSFAATKWIGLFNVNINIVYLYLYYCVFFVILAMSFMSGAARTAIAGMRFIAVLCFSIPLTSILATIFPIDPIWAAYNVTTISVEVAACVFGSAFVIMSQKVMKRAYSSEANSVWHISKGKSAIARLSKTPINEL